MDEIVALLAFLCLLQSASLPSGGVGSAEVAEEAETVVVDAGNNLTLECGGGGGVSSDAVMWVRDDGKLAAATRILEDGSLFFARLNRSDAGSYTCHQDTTESIGRDDGSPFAMARVLERLRAHYVLKIRSPPLGLNVTVLPSTVYALVTWDVGEDGGYPVSSFTIRYRLQNMTDEDTSWTFSQPPLLRPNHRQYQLYHLEPNSSYVVQVWANNKLGQGVVTSLVTATEFDRQEIELAKHLLEGVETFDTRAWMVAVGVVMGTLCVLGVATCCLFYKEYALTWSDLQELDDESIELPNIIVNPTYEFQPVQPDENLNDATPVRINNNSVIYPARV